MGEYSAEAARLFQANRNRRKEASEISNIGIASELLRGDEPLRAVVWNDHHVNRGRNFAVDDSGNFAFISPDQNTITGVVGLGDHPFDLE